MQINYPKSEIGQNLASKLSKVFDSYEYSENDFTCVLEHPGEIRNGDFACNIAMVGFRFLKNKEEYKNPRVWAEDIVGKLENSNQELGCEKIEVAGPGFINFYLKDSELTDELSKIDEYFGKSNWGKGKKWLIEHTSPNPNKSMHLGHLRNNIVGMAVSNIWEELGVEVIRDAVDNNRGIAIAKLMWGYLKFGRKDGENKVDIGYFVSHQDEWKTPEEEGVRPDRFMDQYYIFGSDDFKNKEIENLVRQIVVDWEAEDKDVWVLWEKVMNYSHQGQQLTLARLGNKWDKIWHEHEHYKKGKELVERGLAEGILRKTEDGAVLTNLEEKFNLTDTIVRKNDGTSLYITQDLALTKLKKETYDVDKMFWVIGPEQSLAMKQVFAVCDQLGIGDYENFVHLAYGYMSIRGEGKMSSRKGNVIYIDQLIDMVKEKLLGMGERKLSDEELEKMSVGAVKYAILKVGRLTDMAFDVEKSVALDGDSSVYVNYSYARAKSVLNKVNNESNGNLIRDAKLTEGEREVVEWIYRYPEVVVEAGENYSPNLIVGFVFELCQRFNSFYNKEKIIGDAREELRLLIVSSVNQVIKSGMKLLGIEVVEKM